jgi:hypothetical protein
MPKAARRKSGPQAVTPYPTTKPATKDDTTSTLPSPKTTQPLSSRSPNIPSAPKASSTSTPNTTSFLDIALPGEATDSVPVYDTCSQIRTKIRNLLEKHKDKPENCVPGEFQKNGKPKPFTAKKFCEVIGVSAASKV